MTKKTECSEVDEEVLITVNWESCGYVLTVSEKKKTTFIGQLFPSSAILPTPS